jgi:thiol:disulfide interchange protein DsbD
MLIAFLVALVSVFSGGQNLNADDSKLVKGAVFSDRSAVSVGDTIRVGVNLQIEPGWHIYWKVSGDAGLPTEIDWNLPTGFKVGVDKWPLPKKFTEQESLVVYGYDDEVIIIRDVIADAPDTEASAFDIELVVNWLVCKEVCIPGEGSYQLSLPAGVGVPQNSDIFENDFYEWISGSPDKIDLTSELISIAPSFQAIVPYDSKLGRDWVDFFPLESEVGGVKTKPGSGGGLLIEWASISDKSDPQLSGILVYEMEMGKRGGVKATLLFDDSGITSDNDVFGDGLWTLLLMAFGGGLILNLMPCVLPVVAIKALSVTKHLGGNEFRIRLLGLAFSVGIVFSFLVLASLLIILRSMGQELGWGFQFQYPSFIVGISVLIFILALSQLGVFTFRIPSINRFPKEEEFIGSFLNGFLATILSTPCTAPLLGTAIGFAFTQTTIIAITLFFFIGLGMASPHILLALNPGFYKFFPAPGAWMDRFKQMMAFLLLATVIWLLWVLGRQVGVDGISAMLCFFLCLSVCCWLFGLPSGLRSTKNRRVIWFFSFLIAVFGYVAFLKPIFHMEPEGVGYKFGEENGPWIAFSKEELYTRVSKGEMVFVDFTADWCLTCKINQQTVLGRPNVMSLFASHNVALMRADWTNRNEIITQMLYSLGRSGVPAYVLFPGGEIDSPILLPEILTVGSIEEGLIRAERISKF